MTHPINQLHIYSQRGENALLFLDLGDQTHVRNHLLDRPCGGRGELGEHIWVTAGGDDLFWHALWRHISAEYTLLHAVREQGSTYIESTGFCAMDDGHVDHGLELPCCMALFRHIVQRLDSSSQTDMEP